MDNFPRTNSPHSMGREYWDFWQYPQTLYHQKFGDVLDLNRNKDSFTASSLFADSPLRRDFLSRHSNIRQEMTSTGTCTVKNDANQFQILLDVSQFTDKDVEVKTIGSEVIVHAKHDEIEDEHGKVSREFTRRILLPLGVDPMNIVALYDSKGILAIRAPKEVTEKVGKETFIPVDKESPVRSSRPASSAANASTTVKSESSKRDPSSGRKSADQVRSEFFKSFESQSPLTKTKEVYPSSVNDAQQKQQHQQPPQLQPAIKATLRNPLYEPHGEIYETTKSTYTSSSSVHRSTTTTSEKPTGTRPKQLITDV